MKTNTRLRLQARGGSSDAVHRVNKPMLESWAPFMHSFIPRHLVLWDGTGNAEVMRTMGYVFAKTTKTLRPTASGRLIRTPPPCDVVVVEEAAFGTECGALLHTLLRLQKPFVMLYPTYKLSGAAARSAITAGVMVVVPVYAITIRVDLAGAMPARSNMVFLCQGLPAVHGGQLSWLGGFAENDRCGIDTPPQQ